MWKDKKQSIVESNKDEIYSMQKKCKNTAYDNEFMEKKRNNGQENA